MPVKRKSAVSRGTGESPTHRMVVKSLGGDALPDGTIVSNVAEVDDKFKDFYITSAGRDRGIVIRPPYNFGTLERLEQENNALGPCIDAMEVNIDGTGWAIEREDGEAIEDGDEEAITAIEDFFHEPWPRESFVTMRRKLRRDLERDGMGYLEVLRDGAGGLAFLRHADAKDIRIVRLGPAISVEQKVKRGGKEVTLKMGVRERRFAQIVRTSMVYFKEYGATRDLSKKTGKWATKGQVLPQAEKATELIQFIVKRDVFTPYGVPRWINQIPSVLGSRRAEEQNLSFFNRGGIPPVLVMIQGGSVAAESAQALEQILNGTASGNMNAAVVEIMPIAGTTDKMGTAKVLVERFGSERQKDSMFENYDENSERRVRRSFRLPPIFVGMSQDYSFATAFASYTVAEAQVFKPERVEFDEIINTTLMRELDPTGTYVFRSLPLSISDVAKQLKGIELVQEHMKPEDVVDAINEITGTNLKVDDTPQPEPPPPTGGPPSGAVQPPAGGQAQPQPMTPPAPAEKGQEWAVRRKANPALEALADRVAHMLGGDATSEEVASALKEVGAMDAETRDVFRSELAARAFAIPMMDPVGAGELAEAVLAAEG